MTYPFRYYGNSWLPNDDHDVATVEYCIQFKGPLTLAQRQRLAHRVDATFADGPATPIGRWLWSHRFLLATVAGRYPFANGAICGRFTRLLMDAIRVCPIVDVVCRTATARGTSSWDTWTLATQPIPDPGLPWGTAATCHHGIHPRPIDPTLPAGQPDDPFDEALALAFRARRSQRLLRRVQASGGLSLTPIDRAAPPPRHRQASPRTRRSPSTRTACAPPGSPTMATRSSSSTSRRAPSAAASRHPASPPTSPGSRTDSSCAPPRPCTSSTSPQTGPPR